MFTTQIVEAVPLTGLLSAHPLQDNHARRHMPIGCRLTDRFSRCSALVLMIGALTLTGCSTTGGPNMHAETSPGVVVSEAQAGEAAPKATEESRPNPEKCAVVGAIIGGAIGIAVAAPVCTNFATMEWCPEAILLIGGGMALVGGAVGASICREQIHE